MTPRFLVRGLSVTILVLFRSASATAQEPDRSSSPVPTRDAREEVPILAYTYAAAGIDGPGVGAYGYFAMLGGAKLGASPAGNTVAGGGVLAYGSPIDRLTIVADASRSTINGEFAPSLAVIVRPVGHPSQGFSLGILAKYKIESFGDEDRKTGDGDLEHEIEGGVLVGYADKGWHLDLNGIVGLGLSDDHEVDVEGRVRLGRDLGERVRLGVDGQVRGRASGTEALVGGRTADFAAGPQVLVSLGHLYGTLTAGPSTTGVATGVGFIAVVALGGTTL